MMEEHNHKPNYRARIQLQLIVLATLLGFLVAPRIMQALDNNKSHAINPVATQTTNTREPRVDYFSTINIRAKSAYVWDIKEQRELFSFHGNDILPLASVTKVMMALVANELLPANTQVTIRQNDLSFNGDQGLRIGEKWKLADLIALTLVSSSNDGASALAAVGGATLTGSSSTSNELADKLAFITAMNEKAASIGLTHTTYSNESGLDIESYQSGASGSARDMARLFEYVYRKHPDLLSPTTRGELSVTSESNVVHRVLNTNNLVDEIPGMIGSKTGFTDLAGGNLVMLVDIGIDHPVAIAVLGSTRDERFSDIAQLINATTKSIIE